MGEESGPPPATRHFPETFEDTGDYPLICFLLGQAFPRLQGNTVVAWQVSFSPAISYSTPLRLPIHILRAWLGLFRGILVCAVHYFIFPSPTFPSALPPFLFLGGFFGYFTTHLPRYPVFPYHGPV